MLNPRFARLTGLSLVAIASGAAADTTILFEDFNDLTQAQFETEWNVGISPADSFAVSFIEMPGDPTSEALWPGLTEIAASHLGRAGDPVVTWNGLTSANALTPTESQSIRLSVDIFDNAAGNKRMSVGLRQTTPSAANLIELGFWNSDPANGYAHRAILFPGTVENPNPNWQGFALDASLDRPDDLDEIVTIADIGAGWHTYSVLITPTEMTFELDLFRDGLVNSRDETGIIGTIPGVDASVTYQIDSSAAAFDNLRFGGASGVTSAGGGILVDNILLELIDAVVVGNLAGDFNGSGSVEQGDLDLVLNNWGGPRTAGFVANTDGLATTGVDQEELDRVLNNWGSSNAPAFNGVAVPEPAALSLLAGLAFLGRRRTR